MSNNLNISYDGAVGRITLTQPEIRNAFSDEVIAELTAAFSEVSSRANVRAVVRIDLAQGGAVVRLQNSISAPHDRLVLSSLLTARD